MQCSYFSYSADHQDALVVSWPSQAAYNVFPVLGRPRTVLEVAARPRVDGQAVLILHTALRPAHVKVSEIND
jgi:hypothetical protein